MEITDPKIRSKIGELAKILTRTGREAAALGEDLTRDPRGQILSSEFFDKLLTLSTQQRYLPAAMAALVHLHDLEEWEGWLRIERMFARTNSEKRFYDSVLSGLDRQAPRLIQTAEVEV